MRANKEDYMVVVGFDVSKDSIYGARLDRSGTVKERVVLPNSEREIEALLTRLKSKYRHLLVASEATAEYHRPLALTCLRLGIPFRLLNPITTRQFTRSTIRKKKTDVSDAEIVARVAAQGQGTLVTKDTFNSVKPMLRTAVKLAQISQMLRLMQHHIAEVIPEEQPLLQELEACRERVNEAADVFRVTGRKQVNPELRKLLQSVPGIGIQTAAALIAELGDITRFKDAKAVVAYMGLDPKVKQSGTTLARNTRLTKRGSPYLRRAIYLAAAKAEQHDPVLKATYTKKRAEGKRYRPATIVVARRVVARVYAVWKRGTAYRPSPEV
jgi:transposase